MHGHSLAQYPEAVSFFSLITNPPPCTATLSFPICLPFLRWNYFSAPPKVQEGQTAGKLLLRTSSTYTIHALLCCFSPPSLLLISLASPRATFGSNWECVCVFAQAHSYGLTKPCTMLRAAPRSPPEAELRLSSLFSRNVLQLWKESGGLLLCLWCGPWGSPTVWTVCNPHEKWATWKMNRSYSNQINIEIKPALARYNKHTLRFVFKNLLFFTI